MALVVLALSMLLARAGAEPPAKDATSPAGAARALSDDGDQQALRLAVDETLRALEPRAGKSGASAEEERTVRGLRVLRDALARADGDLGRALAERFAVPPARPVFVTGYHEPTLAARRKRDDRFRHPIHALPKDGTLPSRAEIEDGALDGRGLELFFTDDPIELFFLHVQGSGRLQLEDGSSVRIVYAGNNGKAYRSLGSELVERGVFRPSEATAPAIKRWLRDHPDEAPALLRKNPRYVFFAVGAGKGGQGPPGALAVPLVPWRSVAVDPRFVPLGSIGYLSVPLPGGGRFASLVVAMDTGTAIKGQGRVDLFCGADQRGERVAGELRHRGSVTWLTPR